MANKSITTHGAGHSLYVPLPSNPRLLENGEPHPDCFWMNKSDYGYVSPFREYVESPVQPTIVGLANKWNISYMTLERWKGVGKWDDIRARQWASIQERAWELSKDAIAQVQAKELTEQLAAWRQTRDSIMATLRHGKTVEQSATGKVVERTLSIKDRKDAAQTMLLCDESINRIMGMGKGLIAAGEAVDDPKTARPVRRIRHNYTITEEIHSEAIPDLPELLGDENPHTQFNPTLEGEIVDGD